MVLDYHAQGDATVEHQRTRQATPRRSVNPVALGYAAGDAHITQQPIAHHQKPRLNVLSPTDRAVQLSGIALLLPSVQLPERETYSLAMAQLPRTGCVPPARTGWAPGTSELPTRSRR